MVGQNAASRPKSITHEELLDAFLEHIPDHIYFKDPERRFVRISRALAIHFGLADSAEAVNKTDFDMFTAEHAEQAFADEQEIIRTGRPVVAKEEKETWADGRESWASTTKIPLRDRDGNIIGTVGISRDVTERRRAQQELQEYKTHLEELVAARTAEPTRANEDLASSNARKAARSHRMPRRLQHSHCEFGTLHRELRRARECRSLRRSPRTPRAH